MIVLENVAFPAGGLDEDVLEELKRHGFPRECLWCKSCGGFEDVSSHSIPQKMWDLWWFWICQTCFFFSRRWSELNSTSRMNNLHRSRTSWFSNGDVLHLCVVRTGTDKPEQSFGRRYAINCLQNNKHNSVTTTYYLLAAKRRRMMEHLQMQQEKLDCMNWWCGDGFKPESRHGSRYCIFFPADSLICLITCQPQGFSIAMFVAKEQWLRFIK